MTPKKWRRLGVILLISGIALMCGGLFLGYRFLADQPVPVMFQGALEEAAKMMGPTSGVVILCGPGVIVGLFGYALIEKYQHDV